MSDTKLTDRDITLARLALLRWMTRMANDIYRAWDADLYEVIDIAETYNDARDMCIKLEEMRKELKS